VIAGLLQIAGAGVVVVAVVVRAGPVVVVLGERLPVAY
jgi:hypothetical protein